MAKSQDRAFDCQQFGVDGLGDGGGSQPQRLQGRQHRRYRPALFDGGAQDRQARLFRETIEVPAKGPFYCRRYRSRSIADMEIQGQLHQSERIACGQLNQPALSF